MKATVACIMAVGAAIAALLAFSQNRFAASYFEYGIFRSYSGVVEEWPVPVLSAGGSRYLLVGAGKHGAADAVRGLDRRSVTLQGSLIHRGRDRMLELLPGSLQLNQAVGEPAPRVHRGEVQLIGEIVDTKCYLGVMNPGQGKVHRQCAARCVLGGIPPALAVEGRLYLLTGFGNRPIHREIARFAGERVRVSGELIESGGLAVLQISPDGIRPE
jgi:hypothetical protein